MTEKVINCKFIHELFKFFHYSDSLKKILYCGYKDLYLGLL